ncbi:hypothetical protein OF83DRAFT_1282764 [Amylostereum chailletii]|nr:hypothetical protein OF83DRAFT_1282764 [Amylostereum chailletii]
MLWELVGEGASGKTQLALQFSLCVQLPFSQGGLCGSACYLTTHSGLPTSRLLEISQEHPLLSGSSISLEHIHTMEIKSVDMLLLALSTTLPSLLSSNSDGRPVKVLIVDSIAEVFSENDKASTVQLVERSRTLSEIASQLHVLASQHQLAVVVINHVVDTWDRAPGASDELIYAHQARFFNSADSVAGESRKSAALGLVWANQLNARIMLTRTGRRRHFDGDPDAKRRRIVSGSGHAITTSGDRVSVAPQDTLIRRMSLLFSSVSTPFSADFLVTPRGVELYADAEYPALSRTTILSSYSASSHTEPPRRQSVPPTPQRLGDVALLDVACAETDLTSSAPQEQPFDEAPDAEEDEETYWKEFDDLEETDYVGLEA